MAEANKVEDTEVKTVASGVSRVDLKAKKAAVIIITKADAKRKVALGGSKVVDTEAKIAASVVSKVADTEAKTAASVASRVAMEVKRAVVTITKVDAKREAALGASRVVDMETSKVATEANKAVDMEASREVATAARKAAMATNPTTAGKKAHTPKVAAKAEGTASPPAHPTAVEVEATPTTSLEHRNTLSSMRATVVIAPCSATSSVGFRVSTSSCRMRVSMSKMRFVSTSSFTAAAGVVAGVGRLLRVAAWAVRPRCKR